MPPHSFSAPPNPNVNEKKSDNSSWTDSEDQTLAKYWVVHSQDAQNGNQQDESKFWGKITNGYEGTSGMKTRTRAALKQRWGKIQWQTTFFVSCVIKVREANHSGIGNESHEYDRADTIIQDGIRRSSIEASMKCKLAAALSPALRHKKMSSNVSPRVSMGSDLDSLVDDDEEVMDPGLMNRPTGGKKEKKQNNFLTKFEKAIKAHEGITKMVRNNVKLRQEEREIKKAMAAEHLELYQKKQEREEEIQDMEIMEKNLYGMDRDTAMCWQMLKNEVIKKMMPKHNAASSSNTSDGNDVV
ncbi:hypothetical protein GIB67_010968 [Kingdonia uniflora]|uniref:Myb-like domain-containing protein n=1 Tax=Kingdonia uniflora TaxID=39325 RepID=A0A7J7LTR0_9MAGN|nr:hypothetical protein GIB67_010968 [Kingdonia uniflora]